ncbi:MAG TPA: hypothetical protein VF192_01390 [Longimicrobiales bacterium]
MTTEPELPRPRCPAAEYVAGATINESGCRCRIMELDQARADPILEGAPVGVFISAREDPHTYFGFCAGDGQPTSDPDVVTNHYTACPIYAAAKDWDVVERLFAPERPQSAEEELAEAAERGQLPEDKEFKMFTAEELQWIG